MNRNGHRHLFVMIATSFVSLHVLMHGIVNTFVNVYFSLMSSGQQAELQEQAQVVAWSAMALTTRPALAEAPSALLSAPLYRRRGRLARPTQGRTATT